MRVLLYSAVLYLTGVALVLYFRPSLMFKDDRTWKEFGSQGEDTTYFPFWLFCIVWAVTAYGIMRFLYSEKGVGPRRTTAEEPTEDAKPGYYKLDASLMKRKGVPRYIYVGKGMPEDLEE